MSKDSVALRERETLSRISLKTENTQVYARKRTPGTSVTIGEHSSQKTLTLILKRDYLSDHLAQQDLLVWYKLHLCIFIFKTI